MANVKLYNMLGAEVGEIALSDNLIENPISSADTKSYIFDSTNPTITVVATPVVSPLLQDSPTLV